MAVLTFQSAELMAPTEADAKLAQESARLLAPKLSESNAAVQLQVIDGSGDEVAIPAAAFRLLVTILAEMASGNMVHLVPHHAELTTQQAAELLNVSRPYLVRLLDQKRIPHHKVGTHRRVLFKDLMAYRADHVRARGTALDELTRLSQEMGLY